MAVDILEENKQMKFINKIDFNDYLKLNYSRFYKRIGSILSLILGITFIIISLVDYFEIYDLIPGYPTYQPIAGFVIVFIMPLLIYISAKKNYKNYEILNGNPEFEINEDTLNITGVGFKSEIKINKLYKVDELKSWFIIHIAKGSSNLISKKHLSETQIEKLRAYLVKK